MIDCLLFRRSDGSSGSSPSGYRSLKTASVLVTVAEYGVSVLLWVFVCGVHVCVSFYVYVCACVCACMEVFIRPKIRRRRTSNLCPVSYR